MRAGINLPITALAALKVTKTSFNDTSLTCFPQSRQSKRNLRDEKPAPVRPVKASRQVQFAAYHPRPGYQDELYIPRHGRLMLRCEIDRRLSDFLRSEKCPRVARRILGALPSARYFDFDMTRGSVTGLIHTNCSNSAIIGYGRMLENVAILLTDFLGMEL